MEPTSLYSSLISALVAGDRETASRAARRLGEAIYDGGEIPRGLVPNATAPTQRDRYVVFRTLVSLADAINP